MKLDAKYVARIQQSKINLMGVLGWLDTSVACLLKESKEESPRRERELLREAKTVKRLADNTRYVLALLDSLHKEER